MILGMGVPELAVILIVVLVIFGPKNLPKLGSSLGKTVKNFRDGMENGEEDGPAADVSKAEAADPDDLDA
jgi:sec-independent protein translocase protein TatA